MRKIIVFINLLLCLFSMKEAPKQAPITVHLTVNRTIQPNFIAQNVY